MMITNDHPLLQLLALIDMVWVETNPATAKVYSEQTMFKVYVVSVLKQLWSRRSLWRYLAGMPLVASACGLARIPDRRTLDRRLTEMVPQAERQIQALGLVLSLEAVSDATVASSDGSAFATAAFDMALEQVRYFGDAERRRIVSRVDLGNNVAQGRL